MVSKALTYIFLILLSFPGLVWAEPFKDNNKWKMIFFLLQMKFNNLKIKISI